MNNNLTSETPLLKRPWQVLAAIYLIIISYVVKSVYSLIALMPSKHTTGELTAFEIILLLIVLLFLAVYGLIIYKMHEGKKWARTVFLVFVVIDIIDVAIEHIFSHVSLTDGIGSYIHVILIVVALILLFSKKSNEWYNQVKSQT